MTLLLCFDGYIFRNKGKYYLSEQTDTIIKRYLRVFDRVVVALRCDEVQELEKYNDIVLENNRVEVCPLPFFRGPAQYAKHYLTVRRTLKLAVQRCDAAVFRLPSTVGFVACNYMRRANKPFLVEVVANPNEAKNSAKGRVVKILMDRIDRSLKSACQHADGVSYVTKIALATQYPANKDAGVEFYSSIELTTDFFSDTRRYPTTNKPFSIIHIANFITPSDSKGNTIAMRVIKELVDKGHDVSIIFVGERTSTCLFDDLIRELGIHGRVSFVGRKTKQELRELLLASDLLLFPSRSEGLPRTVIEAAAVGLPCVASDVGGVRELISDEVIFDIEDHRGMAQKVAEIISSKELYEQLGSHNYNQAQMYEASVLEQKRDKFYALLLNNKHV